MANILDNNNKQSNDLNTTIICDNMKFIKGLKCRECGREYSISNDAVSHSTLSFKDRVVSVALSKAKEFGSQIVIPKQKEKETRVQVTF